MAFDCCVYWVLHCRINTVKLSLPEHTLAGTLGTTSRGPVSLVVARGLGLNAHGGAWAVNPIRSVGCTYGEGWEWEGVNGQGMVEEVGDEVW